QGADIIDLGAESTRPGHQGVSCQEELARLEPVLTRLRGRLGVPVSVDTSKPEVAQAALALGAAIINDVNGFLAPGMAEAAARHGAAAVIMHPGEPAYPHGVVRHVRKFLLAAAQAAQHAGIAKESICLDPGFGFGKDYEQNLELLADMAAARLHGYAWLAGLSRKSFIGTATGCELPSDRLAGTIAADTFAALAGADILRVHDVAQAVQAAKMIDAITAACRKMQ
ncbi:MAG: dihydropteroate synthase, partial [Clostridia bacterium]|nr:dihydropteroate synthase [Clostridia bacterium]